MRPPLWLSAKGRALYRDIFISIKEGLKKRRPRAMAIPKRGGVNFLRPFMPRPSFRKNMEEKNPAIEDAIITPSTPRWGKRGRAKRGPVPAPKRVGALIFPAFSPIMKKARAIVMP